MGGKRVAVVGCAGLVENGGLGPDLVENGGEVRAVHRLQLEFLAPLNHRGDHPAGQNLRRLDHRLCLCRGDNPRQH